METNTLFVEAAKSKYRFSTAKGAISTEDLFDLPLTALDKVAVSLDNAVNAGAKSFLDTSTSTAKTEDRRKLEVVLAVIKIKQDENNLKKAREEKRQQKEFLQSLVEKKAAAQLESLSIEEIQARLKALD